MTITTLTVRNVSDEVHRALRLLATQHIRSTEAEVQAILVMSVDSPERLKLGSLLINMSRETGLATPDVKALKKTMSDNRDLYHHEST